jgi:hypothetical protein
VLNAGWKALALAGPIAADNYDWYLVQLEAGHPGSGHMGWASTPQSGDPWLVITDFECPAETVDLAEAIGIGAVGLLYCFGDTPLTVDGFVVTGFGCMVMGEFEPSWLAHPCANMSVISPHATSDGNGQLFWHYPVPGVINPTVELEAGRLVRIVGRFDHPSAATCAMEAADERDQDPALLRAPTDAAADVAQCRLRFAVSEVVVDP